MSRGTFLHTTEGRLRLGWRLGLFVVLGSAVMTAAGLVLPPGLVWGATAMLVGALVAGWVLLAMEGRSTAALGFYRGPAAFLESALGLGLGTLVGLAVVAVMAAAGGLAWRVEAGSTGGWMYGGLGAVMWLAVPAAAEEALLRGYPLQALAEAWGPGVALWVTSLVFACMHLGNPAVTTLGVVNIGAAGLLLGSVYLRTGSLWWATGVHVGWNWAHGYLADVPVSGLEVLNAPLYEGFAQGPDWLSGGGFGPEGSVVSTVVLLAVAAALYRGPWLRPGRTARAAKPLAVVGWQTKEES